MNLTFFLSESHLNDQINNTDIYIDSFSNNIQRKDRSNHGGGLLIYSKEEIGITRLCHIENAIDETIWVQVHGKGQSFILCNTYRPPQMDVSYWTRLSYSIELALQINENIVVTGDLNSDLLNYNNNKLIEFMNTYGLVNVIDKPTRVTEHSSSLLDPIINSQ